MSVLRVLAYLGALPVVSAVLHLLGLTVALSLALGVPLTIAGVVLGIIATRSGRAMPMLTAGLGLWKMVSRVLPMLRLLHSRS